MNQKDSAQGDLGGVTPHSMCKCGCQRTFSNVQGKKFFSRICKDRYRNRMKREQIEIGAELAERFLEIHREFKGIKGRAK